MIRIFPFEDFRVKLVMLKKRTGVTSTGKGANRVWEQEVSIALLTTEFERIRIKVGETFTHFKKADQNIGETIVLKCCRNL
jgi:peptidyl-prolyl cis-trans isomerase D